MEAIPEKHPQPRRKRRLLRWLRRIAVSLAVLVGLLCATSSYIDCRGIAEPPELDYHPDILTQVVTEEDGVRRIGESWLTERKGILQMSLTGDPFTLGYSNAMLTQKYYEEQEASLFALIRTFLDTDLKLWLMRKYVTWRNRDLPDYVRLDHQMEILGLSRAYEDPLPEFGQLYHRLLNYHAAHDISHAVMDHPLVGCTSFAAWGKQTAGGNILIGRNFDFQAGESFDRNKIVLHVNPDKGFSFISVSWAGMVGVVTGINDKRIAVTINAGSSEDKRTIGTPVSLVIRQVLQYAGSLDEAIEIVRASTVFVTDLYLIADGKTGQVVVVEKTPLRCAVRRTDKQYIICANHFLTDELKDDPENRTYMKEGTSVIRFERTHQLVRQAAGRMTPRIAAEILRDRKVPGLDEPVLGHPAAINGLIASHSVIIDATAGIIWVSQHPHQLGEYVPFSVEQFDSATTVEAIAPDPLLAEGAFDRYRKACDLQVSGDKLNKDGQSADAVAKYVQAASLNPSSYLPHLMAGKAALAAGQVSKAQEHLLKAKALVPAYESERKLIDEKLDLIERSGQ